jgi:ferredoxin
MTVIIEIDEDECTQCGLCYNDECPDVFVEGEDGTSQIVEQYRDGSAARGKAPDGLFDCVNKAADSCPVTAIIISQE